MKFLLVSKCGEGLGLLWKIKSEGNDVRAYIKETDYDTCYDGIIEKVKLRDSWIDSETVAIFDSSGMGITANQMKRYGFKVFGGGVFHDKIENDRNFGLDLMRDSGILVPETVEFTDWDQAKQFIKKNKDTRYVFKPSGDLPSKLTYSCSDCDDLLHYMGFVRAYYGKKVKSFVLQEFIEGTIVSSEFWCGKNGFLERPNQTVEVKKFLNDELGPSTGCSGNLVWEVEKDNPIISEGILRAQEKFIEESYIGPIDLNTIFNESGVFGLEWTPRFGLDAMPSLLQLLTEDAGKLIFDCCQGIAKEVPMRELFSGGVRLTIPPYPIEVADANDIQKYSPNKGIPLRGLDLDDKDHFYFYEIMLNDRDELVHSDGTGVIAVVSSIGNTAEQCFEVPYQILEDAKIPDKQYRTDLKDVLSTMYKDIKEKQSCLT